MQRTPNCPNCFRNFSFKEISKTKHVHIPLLLGCGHTFCDSCITKLARLQKTEVICPECKNSTPLSAEGEAGVRELEPNVCIMGVLATNFYKRSLFESVSSKSGLMKSKVSNQEGMKQAVAQIARQKKAEELAKSAGLKCEECFRVAATSRCNKCECVFCALCFEKVHSSSHTLRKHKPFPITKTSSEPEAGCPDHKNRPYEFYDKTDNQPVCPHCVVVGERQGHHIVPITDVVDELKEHFKNSFEDGQNTVKQLERSQRKVCQAVSQVKSEKTQLTIEIREHFHYLCALLQLREKALVKEVEMHHGNDELLEMTIAENTKKSRSVLQELEEVIHMPTKLINKSKELMDELMGLKEMPCVAVKSVGPDEIEPKFSFDKDYLESISLYGSVKDAGDINLELKKLSEVDEDNLLDETSDEEQAQEAQEERKLDNVNAAEPIANTPRSIAAAKLLSIPFRHELVQVTHIRDPCHFMVQRLADLEQVNAMMNALQRYCETADADDLVFEVNVGDMVCAQFSVDNLWYRARVVTIYSDKNPSTQPTIDNGQCIEVIYMDFGNTEWLPLMRLRKMPVQFLEVPDLAVNCALRDIVPPFQEETWPAKAIKAFGSLTGEKPLLMTVLRRRGGGKLYIDLKSPDNDEPTHDDDRPASVRDALVFLEVARFTSPASAPEGRAMFPMRSYKEPILVEEGRFVDVLVTHVTGPDEVYVQKLHSEEIKELTHIMNEMMKMYSGRKRGNDTSRVILPYRGLVCAARFSEDKVWYRALVTAVHSDETVDVTYVDYGNFERVPFVEIRKLPDTFLKLHKQAVPCNLEDVKPIEEDGAWTDEVREFTCNLLLNKSMVAEVKGIKNGTLAIALHDTSTIDDVCINSYLVRAGRAQACGLGVVTIPEEAELSADAEIKKEGAQLQDEAKRREEPTVVEDSISEEQQALNNEEKSETQSCSDSLDVEVEEEEVTEEKPSLVTSPEVVTQPEVTKPEVTKPEVEQPEVKLTKPEAAVSKRLPEVTKARTRFGAYKEADVPQSRQFQAGVTYVGSDGCIYAQEMKEGDQTLINVMKGLMALNTDSPDTSSAPGRIDDISLGQPCAAQFADDGMWYRAAVTGIIRGRNRVEVNYVDFGNSEVVSLSALRMTMPYLDVPRQCLQLSLYGVVPATPDGSWSKDIIGALNNMIVGKDCMALKEREPVPGRPLEVRLCLPEGVNVTESLLARGLVRPLGVTAKVKPSTQGLPAEVRRGSPPKPSKDKHMSRGQAKIQAMLISAREADSMMSRTELPEVGVTFDVTVTHVDEPDCVFIQRCPPPNTDDMDIYDVDPSLILAEDELEKLEQMAIKINEADYFKNYGPLTTAKQGLLCCGQYTEDDMWYRAQVLSVNSENPLTAHVRYVDYGNSEVVSGNRLRGFPSELLVLPIQSIRCRLADIQPPVDGAKAVEGSQWSAETKDLLIQIVAGKTLTAKVVCVGPPVCILLHDHIVVDNDGAEKEVSIGKLLADQQLATFIGPGSAAYVDAGAHILVKDHTNLTEGGNLATFIGPGSAGNVDSNGGANTAAHTLMKDHTNLSEGEVKDDNSGAKIDTPAAEKARNALLEMIINPMASFKLAGAPIPLLRPQEFVSPPKKVAANFNAPAKITPASTPVDQNVPSEVAMGTASPEAVESPGSDSNQGGPVIANQGETVSDAPDDSNLDSGAANLPDDTGAAESDVTSLTNDTTDDVTNDVNGDVKDDVTDSRVPGTNENTVESSV